MFVSIIEPFKPKKEKVWLILHLIKGKQLVYRQAALRAFNQHPRILVCKIDKLLRPQNYLPIMVQIPSSKETSFKCIK